MEYDPLSPPAHSVADRSAAHQRPGRHQRIATYESTYGSLAGVAISMLWLWISVFLVLVGAAVNAEAERQTARDSTVGHERPLGERGAVVADSAPPYPGEE